MSTKALTWDALFLNGSIVSITNSMWRARVQLRAADLGIDDTAEVQTALSLGSHRLAPRKAFEDISKAVREATTAVEYYSVNFGLIRGARYVPEKNLVALTELLRKSKAAFTDAVDMFMRDFEQTRDQMLPVLESALISAARDLESAKLAFERIKEEYPTPDQVRDKFALSWNVYALSSPKSEAVADAAKSEAEGVKSILGDMVRQLRGDIQDKLKAIIESATKGGKINARSIDAAMALMDRVDSLNILGDRELTIQIRNVRKILGSVDSKDVGEGFIAGLAGVQKELDKSVEIAIAEAEQSLTGVGRRKLDMGEPTPTPVIRTIEFPNTELSPTSLAAGGLSDDEIPMEF